MASRQRSWWGWGYEGEGLSTEQRQALLGAVARRFGLSALECRHPVPLDAVTMPEPRLGLPESLAALGSVSPFDRALHSYGSSFADVVRGFRGEFDHPPDVVAYPRDEGDVVSLLDFCGGAEVAVVPFGGGSSVVGGVSSEVAGEPKGVVSLDLGRLDKVLEVDRTSRAARIQAGVLGPALEDQLRPHGLTLRHFPQSFECSSLGGWLATRSGGHYATGPTHIDDFVESLRTCTPAGVMASRRLPGSGAGPSPDRLVLGSEGTLGVITEAWMRLVERPVFRSSAAARFSRFEDAVEATRQVAQAGLWPTNCRLLDAGEAATSAGGDGVHHLLVLGFESADHPVDGPMARALEIVAGAAGSAETSRPKGPRSDEGGSSADAVGTWRSAFVRAPYVRDALVSASVIAETFETACTWDAFFELHRSVKEAVQAALTEVCGAGSVTCRFTHVYPDGPAPYYSVLAPGRPGSEVSQWEEVKAAASEAIVAHGGTITHHHAVGRIHRPSYERQAPPLFTTALAAAKKVLDPAGIMNPGVLLPPAVLRS